MIRGRVVGELWATRQNPRLKGSKLMLVSVTDRIIVGRDGSEELPAGDRLLVVRDMLDAGIGDEVLVSFGSGARNVIRAGPDNRLVLADAAISQIVEGAVGPGARGGERCS